MTYFSYRFWVARAYCSSFPMRFIRQITLRDMCVLWCGDLRHMKCDRHTPTSTSIHCHQPPQPSEAYVPIYVVWKYVYAQIWLASVCTSTSPVTFISCRKLGRHSLPPPSNKCRQHRISKHTTSCRFVNYVWNAGMLAHRGVRCVCQQKNEMIVCAQ